MVLAEALLRVPDAATADRLIEDKLAAGDWAHPDPRRHAPGLGVGLDARHDRADHPSGRDAGRRARWRWSGGSGCRRCGPPRGKRCGCSARTSCLARPSTKRSSAPPHHQEFRYSFDMLGEGARTEAAAEHYFAAYDAAIAAIGRVRRQRRAGATGPAFRSSCRRCIRATRRCRASACSRNWCRGCELARLAQATSISISPSTRRKPTGWNCRSMSSRRVLPDPALAGWDGFGLAVQAYPSVRRAVIDWAAQQPRALDRRLTLRLVKGAYWDTEIKRAQERGLADYPVFTRKPMTDLCYLACARKLLGGAAAPLSAIRHPQCADGRERHRDAGGVDGYEFQRLHGMGEALYHGVARRIAGAGLPRLCAGRQLSRSARLSGAPAVGERRQFLLRLGGGRSGRADRRYPGAPAGLDRLAGAGAPREHSAAARPLRAERRKNSRGVEFGDRRGLEALLDEVACGGNEPDDGRAARSMASPCTATSARCYSPIDGNDIGRSRRATRPSCRRAWRRRRRALPTGRRRRSASARPTLASAADLMEPNRGRLIALMQSEGGKTLDDCLAEVREAVDFCRYYAAQARRVARAAGDAGPDRRKQRTALSRPRRLRLHQPVEFSAGDFRRPDRRRAGRRQCGGGQARRADAADRR